MRKTVLMLVVGVLAGFSANTSFAITKTLIDFNQYEQKLASEPAFTGGGNNAQGGAPAQNAQAPQNTQPQQQGNAQPAATGAGTEEKLFTVTADDMKLNHWMVVLNSSSKQIQNVRYSYAQAVKTKGLVGGGPRTVLGARIHFPAWANIASAEITPPYEFPAYHTDGSISSVENGLIDNTGDLYTITTEVYGRNFDYALYIQLKDENGQVTKYYMGQLFFNGWRKLTWKNPLYIENVDLREIKRIPIFPDKGIPYKKLDSFLIVKNQYAPGGNYLFYVANISVNYDLATIPEDEDIDQEGTWHILSDTMTSIIDKQNKERSDLVELRQQEMKRMAISRGADGTLVPGATTQPTATPAAGQQPAAATPAPAAAPATPAPAA